MGGWFPLGSYPARYSPANLLWLSYADWSLSFSLYLSLYLSLYSSLYLSFDLFICWSFSYRVQLLTSGWPSSLSADCLSSSSSPFSPSPSSPYTKELKIEPFSILSAFTVLTLGVTTFFMGASSNSSWVDTFLSTLHL